MDGIASRGVKKKTITREMGKGCPQRGGGWV